MGAEIVPNFIPDFEKLFEGLPCESRLYKCKRDAQGGFFYGKAQKNG